MVYKDFTYALNIIIKVKFITIKIQEFITIIIQATIKIKVVIKVNTLTIINKVIMQVFMVDKQVIALEFTIKVVNHS